MHISCILSLNSYQVTRPAIERDEDDRAAYKLLIGEHFQPEQLIFVDESHFNRLTVRRNYAWAPRGNRARRRDVWTLLSSFLTFLMSSYFLRATCEDERQEIEISMHRQPREIRFGDLLQW